MSNIDSTSIDLLEYLPEVYPEKDKFKHLEDFLKPISLKSEEIRRVIEDWKSEFNIEECDNENLNHIGNLYGYRPRTSVPNLEGKRRKIRYVMDLWERKGTARAYYLAGIEIDIPTFGLTDNRYTVLSLSHQGRLSTVDEAYLQDNIFHHEGVLILETGSYIHPQLFFEVFLEFLPGGFLLYISQTVHQGFVRYDPPIQAYDLQFGEISSIYQRYLPPIQAEPRWWKEIDLSKPGIFLSDGLYLHDSVGYGLSDYLLPFDPQIFPNLPLGFEVPEGYGGPYGHIPGRPLNLSEKSYPSTDPRLYEQTIDTARDITTKELCRVMCFFGIEKNNIFNSWDRPDGENQPYIINVGKDNRPSEHTHWLFPGIEGDMSGQVIEWDGEEWSYANLTGADYSIDCYGNLYDSTAGIYTDSTCVQDSTGIVYVENIPSTSLDRFTLRVIQDLRNDKSFPSSISGDMSGRIVEWDGTNWYHSCVSLDVACSDSTNVTCIGPCKCRCGTGGTGGTGNTGVTGETGGTGSSEWVDDTTGIYFNEYTTGQTGGAGTTASYVHEESTSSITWNVSHDLNTDKPIVICYDQNDEVVFPKEITIIDSTSFNIEFYSSESGHSSLIEPEFVHEQTTPSSSWTVMHNLDETNPVVECLDIDGKSIVPLNIEYITSNRIDVTFPSNETGYVLVITPEYKHTQGTPSTEWNINHGLGSKYPILDCWNTSGEIIEPLTIETIDLNNTKITFLSNEEGYASFNSSGTERIPATFGGTVRIGSTGGTGEKTRLIVSGGPIWIQNIPIYDREGYGTTFSGTLGENVSFGDVLRYGPGGKLYKELGYDSTTAPVVMALSDGTSNDEIVVIKSGFIRNDSWSFNKGDRLFTSSSVDGGIDTTGELHIGFSTDLTNVIRFDPVQDEGHIPRRFESSLLTGDTGYSGSHGLGSNPTLRCYDSSWTQLDPVNIKTSDLNFEVGFDSTGTVECYVVCIS